MKTKFTLLAVLLTAFFFANSQAYQVPNPTFQIWPGSDSTTAPTGWSTIESIYAPLLTGTHLGLATKDSADHYPASDIAFSVKLTTEVIPFEPTFKTPGTISLGTANSAGGAPVYHGTPFAYRPDTMYIAYKYTTVNNAVDTPLFEVILTKGDSAVLARSYILTDSTNTNTWQVNYAALTGSYILNSNPDTLRIVIASSADTASAQLNSTFRVNFVFFTYKVVPTGLQEIADQLNLSLYPNPTSNVLNISAQGDVAGKGYQVIIMDMSGRIVSMNTLSGTRSTIDTHSFASGAYLCRFADKDGNVFKTDKFIVAK